ncbi:MAG: DUF6599 family protein [Dysgonomonas sp.]
MKCTKTILALLFFVQLLVAQTPDELKSKLPQVDGWAISDKIEIFDSENLFDRINGAAPLFIENNFREMTSMEYTKGDDYITIQAYRHATPEDAFGMYASERSPELKHFNFGGEAQGDDASMFFFAGNIYVKIWSHASGNVSQVLQAIASGLAKNIDSAPKYPLMIQAFPDENKIDFTEAYITSSYIGHEFLKGVYVAKYLSNDQPYQSFIIDAKTKDGAKDILTKYFAFTKQPLDFQEGKLTIKDRYNGDIPAIWNGQYIIGIFSENGDAIKDADSILEKLSENLTHL